MSEKPVVYLFFGDDEVEIEDAIRKMRSNLGDDTTASMNTFQYEGRIDLDTLKQEAHAVPFLSPRRLMVLRGSAGSLTGKRQREDFLGVLDGLPQTVALVLVEPPRKPKKKKDGPFHHLRWLISWAETEKEKTHLTYFNLEKKGSLTGWIQKFAVRHGGRITPRAAAHLANLVGEEKRLVVTEMEKLLAYVNYARDIDVDDVDAVTSAEHQSDVFALVDAIGARDGRKALKYLYALREDRDEMSIFMMIVRQFRLLLMCRELLDERQPIAVIQKETRQHPYVVNKLIAQARNFDIGELEAVVHRLADMDAAMKIGRLDLPAGLDVFITRVTAIRAS